MKLSLCAAALSVMLASPALAQSTNVSSGAQSGSNSSSGVMITNQSHRNASSAIAPGLIAGGLSCSGSASIGGAGAGWGLSLGITKEDRYCNAREDAKYIHGVTGDTGAAKERLCDIMENRRAFARAGRPCAADRQVVRANGQRRTHVIQHSSSSGHATSASQGRRSLTMRY